VPWYPTRSASLANSGHFTRPDSKTLFSDKYIPCFWPLPNVFVAAASAAKVFSAALRVPWPFDVVRPLADAHGSVSVLGRDRKRVPLDLRPTEGDEEALFVGRAPWPAADAHVGPAEDTRNRPTGSVFNRVDLAVKGLVKQGITHQCISKRAAQRLKRRTATFLRRNAILYQWGRPL
jgi:hypothetical protein